jgi:hypothetical protein
VFHHHRIRNAQQSNTESSQTIFFGGISAHLVDLRVNAAIEFNGEPMFEAVEIEDTVFHPELTPKFRAQSTVAQELPRCISASVGLARSSRIRAVGIRIG